MDISKDWKPEEKLKLIEALALEVIDYDIIKHNIKLLDLMERIFYISGFSSEFLENNRDNIINKHITLRSKQNGKSTSINKRV